MAVRRLAADQPAAFEFTPENVAWAAAKVRDYPAGRQASAVIPILWKAQEQNRGWLPEPAIRLVADMLGMPYIRVFEVATFYTMFQLQPVGTVAHVNVCGTTPCMLRGAEALVDVCRKRIAPKPFELSADGRFSWEEVECAGACVNAPMVQIGADTFEDLTPNTFEALLDMLAAGRRPVPGPQSARKASEPITGATTLTSPRKDERPQGSEVAGDGAPDANVDPTSPAAANQQAARPDPRDRTDVEATRLSDAPARNGSPVAPAPQSSGQPGGVDEPERQKPGHDDDVPDDRAVADPGDAAASREVADHADPPAEPGEGVETVDPAPLDQAEADRAAPAGDYAARPDEAAQEPDVAPADARGGPEHDGPGASPQDGADAPQSREADTAQGASSATGTLADIARPAPGTPADAAAEHGGDVPEAPDASAAARADGAGRRPEARRREAVAEPDNLQRISGIGPVIEKTLHKLGIWTFEQIAAWDPSNKEWVSTYLSFKGRIDRERWVEQARALAEQGRG